MTGFKTCSVSMILVIRYAIHCYSEKYLGMVYSSHFINCISQSQFLPVIPTMPNYEIRIPFKQYPCNSRFLTQHNTLTVKFSLRYASPNPCYLKHLRRVSAAVLNVWSDSSRRYRNKNAGDLL